MMMVGRTPGIGAALDQANVAVRLHLHRAAVGAQNDVAARLHLDHAVAVQHERARLAREVGPQPHCPTAAERRTEAAQPGEDVERSKPP
jgi:imidazolonepropionase-like amidohydrolase